MIACILSIELRTGSRTRDPFPREPAARYTRFRNPTEEAPTHPTPIWPLAMERLEHRVQWAD